MRQMGDPARMSQYIRVTLTPSDLPVLKNIVRSTGNFTDAEVEVALEVAEECLRRGDGSGYHFLWYETHEPACGFCCYGPVPCTLGRFEIYWIVVDIAKQRSGIGTSLLRESEKKIRLMGGTAVYLDTSSKNSYRTTRGFYESNGYVQQAVLEDFYDSGDDKIIYMKKL
jgi:ribosomal protein S18 acetylase RimI-like enzyme